MTNRVKAVKTPGAQPEPEATGASAGATTESAPTAPTAEDDDLPPDVQAMIDRRVAQTLAAERAAARAAQVNPATGRNDLPTQEDAMAMVKKDPKRRAVLSRDGWVTLDAAVKDRDDNGFAKA